MTTDSNCTNRAAYSLLSHARLHSSGIESGGKCTLSKSFDRTEIPKNCITQETERGELDTLYRFDKLLPTPSHHPSMLPSLPIPRPWRADRTERTGKCPPEQIRNIGNGITLSM